MRAVIGGLAATVATGLNLAAGFTVDQNLGAAIGALTGTVAITMMVVSWLDKRIAAQVAPVQKKVDQIYKFLLNGRMEPNEEDS